jgi:hypothetical protein
MMCFGEKDHTVLETDKKRADKLDENGNMRRTEEGKDSCSFPKVQLIKWRK